jgi:hypothetical protein
MDVSNLLASALPLLVAGICILAGWRIYLFLKEVV